MDDRKYLSLDELIVWSDNPRHLLEVDGSEFTENEVINILIDVVGSDKMYNLIADIFASKKLMGNVNPVVVPHEGKFYVYDGNRRVSALKIMRNPLIVEDKALQKRVFHLINDEDISFTNKVFVYITDEEEALEIMDKSHTGEQQGIGLIPWEPYQRDLSLKRRGKIVQYPYALNVCIALDYNSKSFNNIAYTDLDRLFGSNPLREYFNIDEDKSDYHDKAEYIVGMLIKYKEKRGFRSFSRHFNLSGSKADDSPIITFCKWVEEQEKNKKDFYFKSKPVEIFTDESITFDMIKLKIFDSKNREINFAPEELYIEYISPNGIRTNEISISEIGDWYVEVKYKEEKHSEKISVKQLLSPKIDFNSKNLFGQGNTIDLKKLIIRATDGHGKDRIKDVVISSIGHSTIVRNIFTAENPIGTYQIAYSFQDVTGAPYSIAKEIRIIDKSNPLLAENSTSPLLSFNGICNLINISETVNRLIYEINNLSYDDNICIVTTSLRTLIELSFDELHISEKLVFTKKGDLKTCIKEFKSFLLSGELSRLCTNYNKDLPSYKNERNCLEQIEPGYLSSYLNLAAHKSISRIDITKVAEIARKYISPILVYISLILR